MSDACGCGSATSARRRGGRSTLNGCGRSANPVRRRRRGTALAGYGAGWAGAARPVGLVLKAAALAVAGWTFVPSTLRRLAQGKIGVGTLMTIAAVGAVILGEVGEAAMLAFLYSISEGLEEYSLARTRRGLRALLALVPEKATVLRDGGRVTVDPAELRVGDLLLVRPGERLATDGVIRTGRTALDVSAHHRRIRAGRGRSGR